MSGGERGGGSVFKQGDAVMVGPLTVGIHLEEHEHNDYFNVNMLESMLTW